MTIALCKCRFSSGRKNHSRSLPSLNCHYAGCELFHPHQAAPAKPVPPPGWRGVRLARVWTRTSDDTSVWAWAEKDLLSLPCSALLN